MRLLTILGCCVLLVGSAADTRAAELPEAEKKKIEHLINYVAEMKDAKFVRNGSEYDAKTAATFIRRKWGANENKISTAREFIEHAASGSGTSGKPYLIRFKDGTEINSGDYLLKELERLEKESPQ